MINTDNCCICGKKLFNEKGDRLFKECFQLCLMSKHKYDNGMYSDKGEAVIIICKSCWSRNNNDSIMKALWKDKERNKKIEKKRQKEQEEGTWLSQ